MLKKMLAIHPMSPLLWGYGLWLTMFILGFLGFFDFRCFLVLSLLILPVLGLWVIILGFRARQWWYLLLSLPLIFSWFISMVIFFSP